MSATKKDWLQGLRLSHVGGPIHVATPPQQVLQHEVEENTPTERAQRMSEARIQSDLYLQHWFAGMVGAVTTQ